MGRFPMKSLVAILGALLAATELCAQLGPFPPPPQRNFNGPNPMGGQPNPERGPPMGERPFGGERDPNGLFEEDPLPEFLLSGGRNMRPNLDQQKFDANRLSPQQMIQQQQQQMKQQAARDQFAQDQQRQQFGQQQGSPQQQQANPQLQQGNPQLQQQQQQQQQQFSPQQDLNQPRDQRLLVQQQQQQLTQQQQLIQKLTQNQQQNNNAQTQTGNTMGNTRFPITQTRPGTSQTQFSQPPIHVSLVPFSVPIVVTGSGVTVSDPNKVTQAAQAAVANANAGGQTQSQTTDQDADNGAVTQGEFRRDLGSQPQTLHLGSLTRINATHVMVNEALINGTGPNPFGRPNQNPRNFQGPLAQQQHFLNINNQKRGKSANTKGKKSHIKVTGKDSPDGDESGEPSSEDERDAGSAEGSGTPAKRDCLTGDCTETNEREITDAAANAKQFFCHGKDCVDRKPRNKERRNLRPTGVTAEPEVRAQTVTVVTEKNQGSSSSSDVICQLNNVPKVPSCIAEHPWKETVKQPIACGAKKRQWQCFCGFFEE